MTDYTQKTERWNLGSDDAERVENFVTNIVADHVEFALAEARKQVASAVYITRHPETRSPCLLFGFGDEGAGDIYVPLSQVLDDAPDTLAAITPALEEYLNR